MPKPISESPLAREISRRSFTKGMLAAATVTACEKQTLAGPAVEQKQRGPLVGEIQREVLFTGRKGGTSWFHPRACIIPSSKGPLALMTLQSISGSDVFGHVHWSVSDDLGKNWTQPAPIEGLGRRELGSGREEGVCDVVPQYDSATDTVLAVGHNVFYARGVLARPQPPRWPVYLVRNPDGDWTRPKKLVWDDPRGSYIYTCNCSQRVHLGDGRVLIPLSFGAASAGRSATSILCDYDGTNLTVKETGSELTSRRGRGLLEPSLTHWRDRFYTTLRAEDGRGYVSTSADGLAWNEQQAWAWDNGKPLTMSTTQQHWLPHSDGLFLVYTRKAEESANVFRWRAPIYLAQVDPERLCLIRDSERVVLPLIGDGINDPKHVARMGNFHPTSANEQMAWVTVGETLPHDRWRGDTLLARIAWRRPNRSANSP